jgi:hypothetical protein
LELLYNIALQTISIFRIWRGVKKPIVETVSLGNLEEAMAERPPGQSISPMAGKPLYIGNREMSDKSRNEL